MRRGWVRAAAAHTGLNAIRGGAPPGPQAAASAARPRRRRSAQRKRCWTSESRTEVGRRCGRLPRRSAAVLVLSHSGLSYAEVAEAMNVKVGHVGTMLRRAESALRKELQK